MCAKHNEDCYRKGGGTLWVLGSSAQFYAKKVIFFKKLAIDVFGTLTILRYC